LDSEKLRAALEEEAKRVRNLLQKFKEDLKEHRWPDKVAVISTKWLDKWKDRVLYNKYEP